MKKSKVIIPALAVLVLSTAASVTGTVAWFTANRTKTVTAGEFAVVNTSDNLKVVLGAGVGTTTADDAVSTVSGYKLTDASFNHTSISGTVLPIIAPNVPRDKVASATALASANTTNLERGTNTYSAFTWTMTFTVGFSDSATKNIGLFLDLSSNETYMHEKFIAPDDDGAGAGTVHKFTAADAGTYYTDAACTTGSHTYAANDTVTAGTELYKAAPEATGKAFRIAFVPTAFVNNSGGYAYTKVWGDNEVTQSEHDLTAGQFVTSNTAGQNLTAESYATATNSYNGSAYAAETAGSGKVLMWNGDNTAIPNDGTLTKASALSTNSNYLGWFKCTAGQDVSITYTCVAWYEGSNPEINKETTNFEVIVASMKFGLADLTD